jgi:hypothetical protein
MEAVSQLAQWSLSVSLHVSTLDLWLCNPFPVRKGICFPSCCIWAVANANLVDVVQADETVLLWLSSLSCSLPSLKTWPGYYRGTRNTAPRHPICPRWGHPRFATPWPAVRSVKPAETTAAHPSPKGSRAKCLVLIVWPWGFVVTCYTALFYRWITSTHTHHREFITGGTQQCVYLVIWLCETSEVMFSILSQWQPYWDIIHMPWDSPFQSFHHPKKKPHVH